MQQQQAHFALFGGWCDGGVRWDRDTKHGEKAREVKQTSELNIKPSGGGQDLSAPLCLPLSLRGRHYKWSVLFSGKLSGELSANLSNAVVGCQRFIITSRTLLELEIKLF